MADIIEIITTIVLAIIGGYLTWIYDRATRYNYLAERWYNLIELNADMSEFFDSEKTKEYKSWSNEKTKTKYNQYARACWGFVEDIIRNDYPWKKSFTEDYKDTIKYHIDHHHVWLLDNKDLFSYTKFSKVLEEKFGDQISKLNPGLHKWMSRKK